MLGVGLGLAYGGAPQQISLPEFAGLSFVAAAPPTTLAPEGTLVGTIVPTGAVARRAASLAFVAAAAPTTLTPVGTLIGTLPLMALTYTIATNPGGRYALDGSDLVTAAALVGGTDSVVVRATDGNGWRKDITIPVVVASSGLSAPRSLAAAPATGGASLTFQAPASGTPTSYEIYTSEDGAPPILARTVAAPASGTSLSGLQPGVPYEVAMLARDASNTSALSAAVSVTPGAAAGTPGAPTSPVAAPGILRNYLTCAIAGGAAASDYVVRWRQNGQWAELADPVSPNPMSGLPHIGLTLDLPYSYRFFAKNASGTGVSSAKVTATPVSASANYYVDSVNGSNGNDGLSAGAAVATIARLVEVMTQGDSIVHVARGSSWRETYKIPRAGTAMIVSGSGAPPVFDGADVATGWTLTPGETDIWQTSVTRETIDGGIDLNRLWVDGVATTAFLNLAALKAAGAEQTWSVSNFDATTATFFVRSATDPNSNGRLYETTRRAHCILAGHPQNTNNGFPADVTGPIEVRRAYSHYNAFPLGDGCSGKRMLIRDGGLHHSVVSSPLMEDCIWREHGNLKGLNAAWEASYHVFFRGDATNMDALAERCFAFGTGPGDRMSAHFYAHGTVVGPDNLRPHSITYRQCGSVYGQAGFLADAEEVLTEGCYAHDVSAAVTLAAPASTVRRTMIRDVPVQTGIYALSDFGVTDTRVKTRLVEHCVITSQAALVNLVATIARNGSLTIRNCLIVLEGNANAVVIASAASGGTLSVTFQNNVIVRPGLPGGLKFTIDAGSGAGVTIVSDNNCWIGHRSNQATPEGIDIRLAGTSYRTLPAWRSATGNDVNSVMLAAGDRTAALAYFEGDWRSGDARLKASAVGSFVDGTSVATAAGPQQHWDFNARTVVGGAPRRWPVPPADLAQQRGYIVDPAAWDFYP